jgi:hypothetical protein
MLLGHTEEVKAEITQFLRDNAAMVKHSLFLRVRGMLRFLLLFTPDFFWIALICGGFAGIWSFLRTGLMLQTLRKPQASKP